MLKIKQIIKDSNTESVSINFEIETGADAYLMQEIFRDAVNAFLSREMTFGLDENFEDILGFPYLLNTNSSIKLSGNKITLLTKERTTEISEETD